LFLLVIIYLFRVTLIPAK